MKRWDEEDNDNYRLPQGKTSNILRFMFFGSLGLLITIVSLYFMEWAMSPPIVSGGI